MDHLGPKGVHETRKRIPNVQEPLLRAKVYHSTVIKHTNRTTTRIGTLTHRQKRLATENLDENTRPSESQQDIGEIKSNP